MANDRDERLTEQIVASRHVSSPVETTLQTDGKVLARVTDGIYRQPASAIRELISNAYDADATRVVISTDRPRFSRIVVEDNGHGMSPAAVTHLIHHIGGSAKRSEIGVDLGVANSSNPSFSPGGRRLIGKIGIGLFSVSQLTQSFRIVTKEAGDKWRTVASVRLKQYSDFTSVGDDQYEAGRVSIWQEPAEDHKTHGTTIMLNNIRPKTKQALQSLDKWLRSDKTGFFKDLFHTGRQLYGSEGEESNLLASFEELPWQAGMAPDEAFRQFVDTVWDQAANSNGNPKLDGLFDYYLQMAWQLGLAGPFRYVDVSPFDLRAGDVEAFELPGVGPGRAKPLPLTEDKTIRDLIDWDPGDSIDTEFRVFFDELELLRPLRFRNLPYTTNAIKKPLIFVGHLREEFPGVDPADSGGPLEFSAYLLWNAKIAPVEHSGVLIRVHGASGTLFDPTFLRFQIAEITRLRQISCEVFVSEGFESALNIDRESFNYSHPHVVRLTSWIHTALTRAINQQKLIGSNLRKQAREEAQGSEARELEKIASEAWVRRFGDDADKPTVELVDADARTNRSQHDADLIFSRSRTLGDQSISRSAIAKSNERKIKAIIQTLVAYGVFDELDDDEQEALVESISAIVRMQG
ncbi:ATP-binding protein [Amycolatopsis sp. NBRC 101858]|uniref:ATP-binding protein n=1 Tax=Amycolatopsis sp. NBRC 101858 TaxID=3032200 RepID=UPI0025541522|nr:ATP-binding protein [Amycolatopsis sp. NBRC 101858]